MHHIAPTRPQVACIQDLMAVMEQLNQQLSAAVAGRPLDDGAEPADAMLRCGPSPRLLRALA